MEREALLQVSIAFDGTREPYGAPALKGHVIIGVRERSRTPAASLTASPCAAMFVAILTYVRPLEEVDALLAEHVRFLDRHYASGLFVVSGRRVPRTGGVILIASDDREHVLSVISADPFAAGGVATYELIEFAPTKMRDGFEPFLKAPELKA